MASEHLELFRATLERVRQDGLRAMLEAMHPDVEFEDLPEAIEQRHRRGPSGIEDWIVSIEQLWEEPRLEVEEVTELDERTMVVVYHFIARAKGLGIEVQQRLTNLLTLQDGLVIRWHIFLSTDEALEAFGRSD